MPRRTSYTRAKRAPGVDTAPRKAYERKGWRQEDKAFYKSKAWRALRALVLAEQPLCADCLKRKVLTPSEHVHHKVDRKDAPELALDRDNLEGLCQPCHNRQRRSHGAN